MVKSSIDMENLFKAHEEYLFVFGGIGDKLQSTIEVFDVVRGIWREFPSSHNFNGPHIYPINSDNLAIIGGKDEFGVA